MIRLAKFTILSALTLAWVGCMDNTARNNGTGDPAGTGSGGANTTSPSGSGTGGSPTSTSDGTSSSSGSSTAPGGALTTDTPAVQEQPVDSVPPDLKDKKE